jgi:hypothetical protein
MNILIYPFIVFVKGGYSLTWLDIISIAHNGLALGAVADFGALNCQPSTKVDLKN